MSVKSCEKLEKSMVELVVDVNAEDFEAAIEKAYKRERGQIRVRGFRPGKAPRKVIERTYGESIFYEEAVNIILPTAYADAVDEQKLKTVSSPQIEILQIGKDGFSFKATVTVSPDVILGQYKGLEAPKPEVQVSDDDVSACLQDMADRNSRMIDQDRAAETGDIVNIDFKGCLDGKPFKGGEDTGFELCLGSKTFVPGFEDQLIGMMPGEEKDIDITFPENYNADLAGKAAVFHVKVNAVKIKEVPVLDDEFAMDVSEFDTLDELREDVRAKLIAQQEENAKTTFEDALLKKVADGIEVEIPEVMIKNQAEVIMKDFNNFLRYQGLTLDQYLELTNTDLETLQQQNTEKAISVVRINLAISAVAEAENIEVSDEEVEAAYQEQADKHRQTVDIIKKIYDVEDIRETVLNKKAVAIIVENAIPVKPEPTEASDTSDTLQ